MEKISIAKKVRAMQRKLAEIRQPYEADWKQIAQYVFYRREFFDLKEQQGQSIGRVKYEGTAGQAAANLAHGIQGYMVSRSINWLDLEFANKELENYKEAQIWLEDLVQYFYEIFKANDFYDTVNDNLSDGIAFGLPCLYSENDPKRNRIVYSQRHPIEIYVAKNRYGEYDTVFRKYKMSSREIIKQFPEGKISRKIKEEAEKSDSMYNEHIITHGVFPNDDRIIGSKMSKDKAFRSVYIEEDAEFEDETLSDKGYSDNPYTVWGWNVNSTEWYARAPAHDALAEILAMNQYEKAILEGTELAIHPPRYVPSKHKGSVRFYPHGINYYENYEKEKIETIPPGGDLPIGLAEREDLRDRIRKYFFNDFFLILAQLIRDKGEAKTATEILELQGEKAAILSPIIGRYESKFLDSIIDRTYKLELEAGRLPQMPPVLEDYASEEKDKAKKGITIRYIGPLATIQERLYKSTGVTHTLSAIAPIAELQLSNAPVMDNFDFDEMAKDSAKVQGASPTHIRGDKEVKKIREARAKALQAQQQMEMGQALADATPKLGKKEEPGSILDQARKGK